MGTILILVMLMIVGMCFCIYNWWYQREKYKRLMDDEKKKLSPFNSPFAWACYSVVFLLIILVIVSYYVQRLMISIMELKQT